MNSTFFFFAVQVWNDMRVDEIIEYFWWTIPLRQR